MVVPDNKRLTRPHITRERHYPAYGPEAIHLHRLIGAHPLQIEDLCPRRMVFTKRVAQATCYVLADDPVDAEAVDASGQLRCVCARALIEPQRRVKRLVNLPFPADIDKRTANSRNASLSPVTLDDIGNLPALCIRVTSPIECVANDGRQ